MKEGTCLLWVRRNFTMREQTDFLIINLIHDRNELSKIKLFKREILYQR